MNIGLTDEQTEAYNNGEEITIKKEIKQWEPKGARWIIGLNGINHNYNPDDLTSYYLGLICNRGLTRDKLTQANAATGKMRKFNRLLAYVDEFAPDFNDAEDDCLLYFIYYNHCHDEYRYSCTVIRDEPTRVFMPEDVAKELARKLNAKEVVL